MYRGSLLLVALAACAAPAPGPTTPDPKRPASSSQEQDAEWRAILDAALGEGSVADQVAAAESEQFTRLGKAWIDKGDFEKARESLQEAVRRWPRNVEARSMLADVNALISGGSRFDEDAIRRAHVQIEQAIVEIGNHLQKGRRLYEARAYADAAREFEEADWKIKHMPCEVGPLRDIQPRVDEMLKRAKAGK